MYTGGESYILTVQRCSR